MHLYQQVTKTRLEKELVHIKCDKCGRIITDDITDLDENCEIKWTIWFACDRDGGGETHEYKTDLCKDCVPTIIKLLRSAGVNVEESHHEF